ncbi:uncharacterized protein LOC106093825 isoform X1 [Stomoxys calcitrans]|nr:uncharacterized protein LOC106093825 isoform X1 [Stomoxys calcitrans]
MGEENSIAKYTTYILLICFMQQINGLSLASTARTFILDGLTTEYATEVILKTPGNSKTYSHVTKKSSRVLYGTAAPLDSHIFSDGHTFANYINPERIFYSNKSTPIDPKLNSQEKLSDFRTASKTKKNSCTTHANCTTNAASNFAFHRNLSTVIYYGFADFTTMVGESVIIFSPSEMNPLFETNMPNMSGDSESVQITEKVENDLPTSAVLDASAMVPDNEKRNTQVWKDLESVGPHPEFTPITDNHFQNDIIIDSRTNEQQQDNMIQSLISPSKVSSNGELSEELQGKLQSSKILHTDIGSTTKQDTSLNGFDGLIDLKQNSSSTIESDESFLTTKSSHMTSAKFSEFQSELHVAGQNKSNLDIIVYKEDQGNLDNKQIVNIMDDNAINPHTPLVYVDESGTLESSADSEVIYKTFYTVYTYFTTLFQSQTSILLSQTDVLSSVVISAKNLSPSYSGLVVPTTQNKYPDEFLQTFRLDVKAYEIDNIGDNVLQCSSCYQLFNSTNKADDEDLTRLFTTYTFYTTIYSGSDSTVVAHSAVFAESVNSTKPYDMIAYSQDIIIETLPKASNVSTVAQLSDIKQNEESSTMPAMVLPVPDAVQLSNIPIHKPEKVDLLNEITSDSEISTPSATLLVQTGFTTQTFFTTVYSGEKSDVFSHLETVTTTMTETYGNPVETDQISNAQSPITYYTTFTFWTKLAVKGQITTISREEITSNIFTPNTILSQIDGGSTIMPTDNSISLGRQDDPSNSLIEYTKYSTIDNFTDTNHRRRRRSTNSKSRFRRPRPLPETREEPRRVEETTKAPPPQTGNFRTRTKKPEAAANNSNGSNKRVIRPSHVSANASSRSKFTLREKEFPATTERSVTTAKRPPFRKPQASSGIKSKRPSSTPSSQLLSGKRRLNNHANNNEATSSRNMIPHRSRSSPAGRSRGGTFRETEVRNRNRNTHESSNDVMELDRSGYITATHVIPGETYLPIINGKSTELKLIVTARTSTEVLGPQQYTKTLGTNGQTTLALTTESSSINSNGATEVIHYILREIPTTTITFTPTSIRGRKTSFSLVLPSTAYSVDQVVSTIQPQLQADTPLANILLSQLLLGNAGFPSNLLYGLVSPTSSQTTVEYVTRTSTYVTTLFEGKSTVLPITFQGKKILTTIYDTTAETITATEFITDTIVSTPSAQSQLPMVNSLLLQQLLFQHINEPTKPENNININDAHIPQQLINEQFGSNSIRDDATESNGVINSDVIIDTSPEKTKPRRAGKKHKRKHKEGPPADDMSVITLYVSGKRPGEFSTILSTLQPEHSQHKRSLHTTFETSIDFDTADHTIFDFENANMQVKEATQSLTSIVGDVNKWYVEQESAFSVPLMPTFSADFS